MNVKELRMIMMKSKKSNPNEAKVYVALLSTASLIAKEDGNREITEKDIVMAAKKELKMAEQSKTAGAPYLKETFQVCESFLPKTLSEDETKILVLKIIEKLENPNMGLVMRELKSNSNLDMKLASKVVKSLL